ncbi:hypothetical protein, partial [Frankia canadensis]|uniref:hypothetical protein n=1 Tax=Frankia canadensis TaxID=1836972 RepID=UPI001403C4CF
QPTPHPHHHHRIIDTTRLQPTAAAGTPVLVGVWVLVGACVRVVGAEQFGPQVLDERRGGGLIEEERGGQPDAGGRGEGRAQLVSAVPVDTEAPPWGMRVAAGGVSVLAGHRGELGDQEVDQEVAARRR